VLATPIAAYLRRFHNRTACTLVATQQLAEHLQSTGFTRLRVLHRGVDTRMFSPARRSSLLRECWGAGPEDPVLLYVGRLAAEKNLELAIAAFEIAQQHCPAARFVLVGDGPVAATLQARYPHFIFAGLRRGEDLAKHYASADIFMFPSLTETFGNVILEAMASGLAVVAFDYAAARQHIEHNRNGLRVPYQDNQAFVAEVQSLIEQPNQSRALGKEASRAAQRWDWQHVHDHLEAIFLELAHSGSGYG
jgi:glycosyltransferase involved in cell wall biosynthesis